MQWTHVPPTEPQKDEAMEGCLAGAQEPEQAGGARGHAHHWNCAPQTQVCKLSSAVINLLGFEKEETTSICENFL